MSLSLPVISPTIPISVYFERWVNGVISTGNKYSIDWNILQSLLNIHNILSSYDFIDITPEKKRRYRELVDILLQNYSAMWSSIVLNSTIINGLEDISNISKDRRFLEEEFNSVYDAYHSLLVLATKRAVSY